MTTEVKIQDAALVAILDKVTDGAASSFIGRTTPILEKIRTHAVSRWPVSSSRRRRHSRDCFEVRQTIGQSEIRTALVNTASVPRWGAYAYKIHWGSYSREEIIEITRKHLVGSPPAFIDQSIARMVAGWNRSGRRFPAKDETGEMPWIYLVRTPAKAAMTAIMPELKADLLRLARG